MPKTPSDSEKWQKPTKHHGARWKGFLMSVNLRNDESRRRKAKCTHCSTVFDHGKPYLLFGHIKEVCNGISPEEKSSYLEAALKESRDKLEDSTSSSPVNAETENSTAGGQSRTLTLSFPSASKGSITNYFRPMSNEHTQYLHELMLKTIVSSNLPFTILENPYFQQYQQELARCVYKFPRRKQMVDNLLPTIHAAYEVELTNNLKKEENLTISLDGWTDTGGNSIYAVLVQRGPSVKHFVEILDLNCKRHSAENIYKALKETLARKTIDIKKINAIVTDSPSVMLKFRKLINNDHPHVMKIHCALHVFNLIAKQLINHPIMEEVVKGNKTLVNYFTTSGFWREHLHNWRIKNNVSHGLSTLCETRWYSMAKLCLGVESHEEGFKYCLETLENTSVDTPSMTKAVINVIKDRDHFTSNSVLVKLLKPIVDGIAHLESSHTTLASIWGVIINTYTLIQSTEVYSRFQPFKEHCINVLADRVKVFQDNIYIIAFFLHPSYRKVAVSRKHSLADIGMMILEVAKCWNFTRSEALHIQTSINRYYNNLYPFNVQLSNFNATTLPLNYWMSVPITPEATGLKKFAIRVMEIVPHAAGVEGLFSMMNSIKTKSRNRMNPSSLKMLAQLKLHMLQGTDSILQKRKAPSDNSNSVFLNSEYENMLAYDRFQNPSDLEEFERGNLPIDEQSPVSTSRENAWMETIFDFDLWEKDHQPQDVIVVSDHEQTEDPDCDWDPTDVWVPNS
ncbi:hypothetical protein PGT21_018819 [Puccinia graminis f. sp. tritici]|uniref:DUF659 domain-containing protein n=1 Tax=Puccinia graminis f. sp. tritici TaxID=56615 RepID=A0A5B0NSX6_PUCGR|nr:hypothetical protein PGT21_018819 [Puccinia graminis f. sp. tritici]KAA1125522.1 hypothetical protein PGTUg99_013811 [Puccinia graminis f. sp. tritici]